MIKLYIFDQGGVLNRDCDVGPAIAARLGLGLEAWRAAAAPDLWPFMRGEVSAPAFWERLQARSGIACPPGVDLWEACFEPVLDAPTVDLVRELGARARVVSGTNTIDSHHRRNLLLGHYDALQKVYASHLLGAAKPEPEFWLRILGAEGVAPEEAFFTDDFPENVEAAAALGLHARLYTGAAALRADLLALGAPVGAEPIGAAPGALPPTRLPAAELEGA